MCACLLACIVHVAVSEQAVSDCLVRCLGRSVRVAGSKQAMPDGGTITISTDSKDEHVTMTLRGLKARMPICKHPSDHAWKNPDDSLVSGTQKPRQLFTHV